jgi:DNA-binding winged helix-turn-helix (wHTH) protein
VSRDVLIDRLWSGNRLVGDPALNRLASEVRRAGGGAGGEALLFETV